MPRGPRVYVPPEHIPQAGRALQVPVQVHRLRRKSDVAVVCVMDGAKRRATLYNESQICDLVASDEELRPY
jgi:hypothetical protein